MTLPDQLRTHCRELESQLEHVRIDRERLQAWLRLQEIPKARFSERDRHYHLVGSPDRMLAYFLLLDCLNFGSGCFPLLKRCGWDEGYFSFARLLKEWFEADVPPKLQTLQYVKPEMIMTHMHFPPQARLLGEAFTHAITGMVTSILEREGSFEALVESAGKSASKLVERLAEIPSYTDIFTYKGFDLPFLKRAQITAADLYLAFDGQGYGAFDDLDVLTVFADNRLPHVLRTEGILIYTRTLGDLIDGQIELTSGSNEEIEIRAATILACELMVEQRRSEGQDLCALDIDNYLWNLGEAPKYRESQAHLCRTCYY